MLPTKGEAYELFWRAKVPLKKIMDQLQMSKSTILRLLRHAKENLPCDMLTCKEKQL